MQTDTMTGLLHAYLLDAKGGARLLAWDEIASWTPAQGCLWLHFDYTDAQVRDWIQGDSQLDPLVADALVTEETRPRATAIDDGLLIALRGVNLNPGSEPDDMVALRLWIDENRVISTRKRRLLSVGDLVERLQKGKGPRDSASLLVELVDSLVWRMSDTVDQFEETINELEDAVLAGSHSDLRYDLATLRRQTITIRRYLSPQRDALSRLISERVAWIEESHRLQLREVSDRLIRHIEDIDVVRERAAVTQEELLSRVSEELNKRMYVLSIVAAVFLPLGFFTGLLGINVGGIPGAENTQAFWIFCGLLVVLVLLQVWLFKWKKWM